MSLFCGAIQDPQGDLEKHSISKPVSMAARIRKVAPSTLKALKMYPKIKRIQTSGKSWFWQPFLHQMLVSGAPDVQIQTLKSFTKVSCKQAWKGIQMLVQGPRKTLKWDPGIHPKSIQIQAWSPGLDPKISFLVLPGAPGSSHGPPGLGTKNDRIPFQDYNYA